jgi:hypothetical protein
MPRDPEIFRGRYIDRQYRTWPGSKIGFNNVGPLEPPATPPGKAPAMKTLVLDLATARTDVAFEISGDVLNFTQSTNTTDLVQVRYDALDSDPVPFLPGFGITGRRFTRVFITNAAIPGATATFFYTTSESTAAPIRIDS